MVKITLEITKYTDIDDQWEFKDLLRKLGVDLSNKARSTPLSARDCSKLLRMMGSCDGADYIEASFEMRDRQADEDWFV